MSDYTKIVDYAAKDALITGNPVKLVKGTELGAEYDAIAVAIATKANTASPAFTGVSSFAVGAVGAPSIYMTGYATTGFYNIGANNWGFAVSGAKVLDIASTGLSVSAVSATFTLSATGASNPLMYLTTTRAFGTNRNWQIGVDQYAEGHWTLTPSTAQGGSSYTTPLIDVSSTGLAVTGATTSSGGFVGSSTTSVAVNGTGSSLMLGYIDSAITSTTDAFVSWMPDTHALNPAAVNGSLLVAARNTAGAEVVLVAENAVRARVSSTGLAVTGVISATGTSSLARIDQSNGSINFASLGNGSTSWQIGTVTAGKPLDLFIGGSVIATVSTTGLAVTGTIGATSTLTSAVAAGSAAFTMGAAARFYLDGGVDTFITESSGNNIQFVTGGSAVLDIASTGLSVSAVLATFTLSATGVSNPLMYLTTTRAFGTNRNWQIGVDEYAEGHWTLTPSTAQGGSSYTTPLIDVSSTGLAVTGTTSTTTGMAVGGATAGAGGIAFPATAVAVDDVNTLDDYEEGSWTPSQGSGLTLVGAFSSTGKYTKIGNVVTVTGTVSGATSVACASAALLTENLPFQASITGRGTGVAVKSGLDGACFFVTGTNGISIFTDITACPTIFFSATYLV